MQELFDFIQGMCEKYSIDESHGLKHAKGTYEKAKILLGKFDDVTEEESRVTLYSAALHDTCDSKYTDVYVAAIEIQEWLLRQGILREETEAILSIITTMSYSKLKVVAAGGPPVYPNHGKWQRAYHVARHADLLEGYVVARSFLYNIHIHPELKDVQHWLNVRTLFDSRIFNYVKNGWITIPGALEMVPDLEREARRCLQEESLDW